MLAHESRPAENRLAEREAAIIGGHGVVDEHLESGGVQGVERPLDEQRILKHAASEPHDVSRSTATEQRDRKSVV